MAKGRGKKKAKNISNVYSMFEQSQIQEFKEAFGMIDANQDGFIDKDWIYLTLVECSRIGPQTGHPDERSVLLSTGKKSDKFDTRTI